MDCQWLNGKKSVDAYILVGSLNDVISLKSWIDADRATHGPVGLLLAIGAASRIKNSEYSDDSEARSPDGQIIRESEFELSSDFLTC